MSADNLERRGQLPALGAVLAELAELVARRVAEIQDASIASSEQADDASRWLSVSSAAEYLDWPKARLYKLSARGAIPHYKQDGRLLFRQDELDQWLSHFAEGRRA